MFDTQSKKKITYKWQNKSIRKMLTKRNDEIFYYKIVNYENLDFDNFTNGIDKVW